MSFLAGAAAGPLMGAAGGLLGGLLGGGGGSAPQINFTPPGFSAGGLNAAFGGNAYSVNPSADRLAQVGGVSSTFGQQADALKNLGTMVTPGFSAFRQQGLQTLNNNRNQAMGDLRDNLSRRRIMGSSFAQDSIARADQEYQKTQSDFIAKTYLQEIDASNKLIQQQFEASRGQFQTFLSEMNLEAGIASDLTGKASSALSQIAQAQAKLDAEAAAGKGKFFGGMGQQLGSGIGSLLSGSGGAGAAAGDAAVDPAMLLALA